MYSYMGSKKRNDPSEKMTRAKAIREFLEHQQRVDEVVRAAVNLEKSRARLSKYRQTRGGIRKFRPSPSYTTAIFLMSVPGFKSTAAAAADLDSFPYKLSPKQDPNAFEDDDDFDYFDDLKLPE